MAAHWLYPLSSKADYRFVTDKGSTDDTGPTSFEEMILGGAVDDEWGAYKNWRRMQKGDRMWVYYGTADGDLGIVGCASIQLVEPPPEPGGRAVVHLRWSRAMTLRLLKNPFPAKRVRDFIGHPQGSAWRIDPVLAEEILRHATGSVGAARSAGPAAPIYGAGIVSTVTYSPPAKVTAERRHDALLRPLMVRLESAGWSPVPFDVGSKKVDLAMGRRGRIVLVEAKTFKSSSSGAVRAAFAQLAEYSWRYSEINGGSPKAIVQWALLEAGPSSDEVRFLEAHGLLVSWASKSKRRFIHGQATDARVAALGM